MQIKDFLGKFISRKFLVWLVATHMTYLSILEPSHWLTISLLYIGAQAAIDWSSYTTLLKRNNNMQSMSSREDTRE